MVYIKTLQKELTLSFLLQIIRPTKLLIQNSYPIEKAVVTMEDKENRLKLWQNRLKNSPGNESTPVRNSRLRNQTGIDQDEVCAALRLNKEKEETTNQRIIKIKEHENDEGFEESQSLMSESPSQGTSSDFVDSGEFGSKSNRPVRTSSLESKCTVDSTSASSTTETPSKPKRTDKPINRMPNDRIQPLLNRYRAPIERSNSVRSTSQNDDNKKSVIPRRSINMLKTDSQHSITNKRGNNVERSNSRASLVSSRSSLNSVVSTNTVKKMPLKTIGNQPTKPLGKTIPIISTRKLLSPANSQTKTAVTIKRGSSGQTLLNQRPSLRNPTFMKPTTSSTTKTHTPSAAPTGRLLSFRAASNK